jgi:hypothetical protein
MGYPSQIPDLNDGTVDHDYDLVDMSKPYFAVRREAAAALDQPATITISHQTTGSGLQTKTRSLVRLDRVVEDADGNQATQSAYLVVEVPEKITTTASVTKTVAELVDFLGTSGYVAKLLNKEV